MTDDPLAGRFLIATPLIDLPPFGRSVVLLLEHDETGSVGLILNKDSGLLVADLLPDVAPLVTEPAHVFIGGPVSTDTAVALAHAPERSFLRPSP
ncbi:MAG: YqgE/AlgH family protein, partial [Actinomycetia bacterium]|nr:YqgE/AlgH family protein [Actinomycetes bacterium]